MLSQTPLMHTCRYISTTHTHTFFGGFVYTAIAGQLSGEIQCNEGSKHFTYRENQRITALSHDTAKTSEVLSCFCYSCGFFFILMHIFNVSFDLLILFFSLFTFLVSKVIRVQALWKLLCSCACLLQWSSPLLSWRSLMWLCVCVLPFVL